MSHDHDLQDRLDRAIGEAPPPPPLGDVLGDGRRVVRRRRAWVAGPALAAAAVVTVAGLVVATGSPTPRVEGDVAAATSLPTPSSTPTPEAGPGLGRFFRGLQADYDGGRLVVRPGAQVVTRVDDPSAASAPVRSVGLVTRWRGRTYWSYVYSSGDGAGGSQSIHPGQAPGATFEQWLADEAVRTPGDGPTSYVDLGADGALTPANGTEILAQTAALPDSLVPDDYTGVAALVAVGPARLCVIARHRAAFPGYAEYLTLNASQTGPGIAGCVTGVDGWEAQGVS